MKWAVINSGARRVSLPPTGLLGKKAISGENKNIFKYKEGKVDDLKP